MRMMLRIQLDVAAGNRAIADGSLGNVLGGVMGEAKPDAAYFLTDGGKRTVLAFFDFKAPEQIPVIAEPLFHKLNATVEFVPVMIQPELEKGLQAWATSAARG